MGLAPFALLPPLPLLLLPFLLLRMGTGVACLADAPATTRHAWSSMNVMFRSTFYGLGKGL